MNFRTKKNRRVSDRKGGKDIEEGISSARGAEKETLASFRVFLFLLQLSHLYLAASPVLYSRVSMAFFLWYLLFGCPCPCLGAQPSGNVSTRELSREVPTQPSWHNQGWILYIHWTMQLHAYIQMERLAFPRVHWRVQACGDERGTREAFAERPKCRRGEELRIEGGGRARERERYVIVKPWHSSFLINKKLESDPLLLLLSNL